MTSGHPGSPEDTQALSGGSAKRAGRAGKPLRSKQTPVTINLLPLSQPHLPGSASCLASWSGHQRHQATTPRGQGLTLFSARSFSFCSCRLLSIQAAVSSSQGSSSPRVLIFLRGKEGPFGSPALLPHPNCRAPGQLLGPWPCPPWLGPPHPSFWFRRRFSLAAASFSRSSSRCRKIMGLMTSAATGSSLVPASGRGAQT